MSNNRHEWYKEYALHRKPSKLGDKMIRFWHAGMLQEAKKVIGKFHGKNLIEIGVGHGYFAYEAIGQDIHYTGIEMNKDLCQNLKMKNFNVINATFPPMPEVVAPDIIWMSHVLEHAITYAQAREMVGEIHKTLKPGGHAIIICPDLESLGAAFWNDWTHGFPTTPRRCTQIFNDVGFNKVKTMTSIGITTNPFFVYLLNIIFRLLPYKFLDWIFKPFFKDKTYFYSFMTLFGWKNVFLIAQKEP